MVKKAPRRTAARILEVARELFNRFGEPNVPVAQVAAELGISPGNLHYHYKAKDELVNALFDSHAETLGELLAEAPDVRHMAAAESFLRALFGQIWYVRFLYRDLGDLLSRNRRLETRLQPLLADEALALRLMLDRLRREGVLSLRAEDIGLVADSMMMVLTFWPSHEYVRAPRQALEPEAAGQALTRGLRQVLHLLAPYQREGVATGPAAEVLAP
ncbi:MAG: TetR/AcrR family transcriptional regulator [Burkholderiaceae bacterium]|nr:TetR/AcrR family transcriptional regulator [Burkholderiaceae bacterium]